jgi:hypothetical protein
MINFIAENGAKVLIDPDDVAAVSSTSELDRTELMFMDGTKISVLGTITDVCTKLEGDENAE